MLDHDREAELREAIELLYFGYRGFTAGPDEMLRRRRLGRAHHRILYFVARRPDLHINDLLTTLGVTKQAVNGPLRQLLALKLVSMTPAAHDRRVRQLRLTGEGQRLEAQLTGTQMQYLAALFEHVGADAESGWRAAMRSMAAGNPKPTGDCA